MALVEWKDEFSVGVASVDFEHRALIDLINALHARLAEGGDAAAAGRFLGEIYARISAHFALEERLMREAAYPEYAEHKADHERLLDAILDIMDDYEMHGALDEAALADRLKAWFADHFNSMDARLHRRLGDAAG